MFFVRRCSAAYLAHLARFRPCFRFFLPCLWGMGVHPLSHPVSLGHGCEMAQNHASSFYVEPRVVPAWALGLAPGIQAGYLMALVISQRGVISSLGCRASARDVEKRGFEPRASALRVQRSTC